MANSGEFPEREIDRLIDARLTMQAGVKQVRKEVEREFQPRIEEEVAYRTKALERAFAVQLVEAKEQGATYADRVKIVGTGKASVMRHFMDLGGGGTRRPLNSAERIAERKRASGLKHLGGLDFIWTIDGREVECRVYWRDGRPDMFPVGHENTMFMMQEAKITTVQRFAKGTEAVELFELEETND